MPRANLSNVERPPLQSKVSTKQVNFLEILFNDVYPGKDRSWRMHFLDARGIKVSALDEMTGPEAGRVIAELIEARDAQGWKDGQ